MDGEVSQALARAAEQARRAAAAFDLDLEARRLSLAGEDDAAGLVRLEAQQAAELARAQELVQAGTLTEDALAALTEVLAGEFSQVVQDIADAAQRAADDLALAQARFAEDLEVRRLIAEGRTGEADTLRQEIRF